MYAERPSIVPGAVVWTSTSDGGETRILPDGCIDVILLGDQLVVAGPDAVARSHRSPAGTRHVGLRFAPGSAPAVLGLRADELCGRSPAFEDCVADPRDLPRRVAAVPDPAAELERAFRRVVHRHHDPIRSAVTAGLAAGQPVGDVARRAGLSPRQLHRRSLEWYGYGPKHLAAVLRLQRAVALGRTGRPAATIAADTGYSDQAHLSRDARRLAGVTFSTLVAQSGNGA